MSSPEAGLKACQSMTAALDSLRKKRQGAIHGEGESTEISAVLQASEAVKSQASKMALLYKTSKTISARDAESLVSVLTQNVVNFCGTCCRFCDRKGQAVRETTVAAVASLVRASQQLIKGLLVEGTWGDDVMDLVRPLIGYCDDIAKLPETDREALLALFQKVITSVTAAAKEIQVLIENSALASAGEQNDRAEANGNGSDDFDVDWPALDPTETAVALAAASSLQSISDLMEDGANEVKEGSAWSGSELEEWDSIVLFHCPQLDQCVVNLSAGLYPPQSHDEVLGDIDSLVNTVMLILDEMPLGRRSKADCNAIRDKLTALFASLREAALQLTAGVHTEVFHDVEES
eukprot:jgi/Botrbrau1/529/Bobra.0010s0004.1